MAASTRTLSHAAETAGLGLGVVLLVLFGIASGVGIAMGEIEAMVASVAVIACVAALIDYRAGALLLTVLLPIAGVWFFPHSMFGFTGLNPVNLLLGATLVSFLLRGRQIGLLVPRPLLWLYVVPILVAGLIGARHVDDILPFFYENLLVHFTDGAGYFRDIALKPLFMVLTALLVGAAVAQSQKSERFLAPIVISVWVMCLTAIGYVASSGMSLGEISGTGSRAFFSSMGMHANDLGRLYAVAYALLLFTWGESKDRALRTVLVATMGLITLALLLTFSRGAFVGFLLVNALFLLWKFNAKTLALAVLVIAVGALLMPGAVLSRMSLGFESGGTMNTVSAGRIEGIWLPLMFSDFWKSPIWGSGLDSILWSDAAWAGTMELVTHPHNAYLQTYLDMGLLGLALLLAYFAHVWRGLLALGSNAYLSPTMRGFFQGAFAGLLCFLVTGMAGSSLRPIGEFAFLWIAIGMMYGVRARTSERTGKGSPPPIR
jgi:O-antigen ligase